MKRTINFSEFTDAFTAIRPNNFSYDGLKALYEYLEEWEESGCGEVELDVIALCCEFTEYENLEELQDNYSDIDSMEELQERTTVITIEGSDRFIIQDF